MPRRRAWVIATVSGVASLALVACTPDPDVAPIDALDLPTGLAESPDGRWLFVTNGNWDRSSSASSLIALDLDALEAGVGQPRAAGAELDGDRPCRVHADDPDRVECAVAPLLDRELGVRLPSGAGNIAIDRPAGDDGPLRLLIPTRIEPTVAWVDVFGPGFGAGPSEPLRFQCGQNERRHCDSDHHRSVEGDPARLTVDDHGFRFAYLPHLLGRRLTLLALDGPHGPEVVDVEAEFFREDGLFETGLGGGFAVAQRACDLDAGNVPDASRDCARPVLFASQRFWWGVRQFQVAPGLDLVVRGGESTVLGPNLEAAEPKPLMGGLAFEDAEQGDRLLIVHTTPPALTRLDTSLDADGEPVVDVVDTVGLCTNPNVVVVHRPDLVGALGPRLAAVSCYGSDQVAIVDLGVFTVVATVDVGDGPNELLIDAGRQWLLVANTAESTVSIIELDAGSVGYLREIATVGLGSPGRADD